VHEPEEEVAEAVASDEASALRLVPAQQLEVAVVAERAKVEAFVTHKSAGGGGRDGGEEMHTLQAEEYRRADDGDEAQR